MDKQNRVMLDKHGKLEMVVLEKKWNLAEMLEREGVNSIEFMLFLDDYIELAREANSVMKDDMAGIEYHQKELRTNHADLFRRLLSKHMREYYKPKTK
jgi:hypothetical protein